MSLLMETERALSFRRRLGVALGGAPGGLCKKGYAKSALAGNASSLS